jgi:uncharacterized OB-fold protein
MRERPLSDISFNQFLKEEKLMGSRCTKCGELYTPPRSICINCYNRELEWVEMIGTGKLIAFTCISVVPKMMADEGFNRDNPYCVGVVELKEGTRVNARIEGIDPKKPEDIKVGMPVRAKYLHRGEGNRSRTILAFEVG